MKGPTKLFSAPTQVLERREFKYLVPDAVAQDMGRALSSICSRDSFAGPSGSYTIRSLYFDSDNFGCYWANEREQFQRFKCRIRSYPPLANNVWFEVKAREGDTISKTRVRIPGDLWQELLENPSIKNLEKIPMPGRKYAERFLALVHTHHLKPRVTVEYDREALFSRVDDYARVTFDRAVRCQIQNESSIEAAPHAWRPVDNPTVTHTDQPMCVVELKFGALVPRWMSVLAQNYELIRYSFSKYCYSVDTQLLLPSSHVAGIQAQGMI